MSVFNELPSHIVPAGQPIEKVYAEVKKIDEKINNLSAKLADIQEKQGEGSSAYTAIIKKIQEQDARKSKLLAENSQYAWAKQYTRALVGYANSSFSVQDEEMFEYLEARVQEEKFAHVIELYAEGTGKMQPAYLRQVNQCPAVANRIVGEIDAAGFRYFVSVLNSDAVNDKLDRYAEEMAGILTKEARQRGGVAEILGQPLQEGDEWQVEMPDFTKMSFNSYEIDEEVMVKRGLDYLMRKPDAALKYKFSHQGMRGYLATGKLCFEAFNDIDDPNISCVDPRDMFAILSPGNPFIHMGTGAGKYFAATPQEIIDLCPELPAGDVLKLQDLAKGYFEGKPFTEEYLTANGCFYVEKGAGLRYLYIHCYKVNWRADKRMRLRVIENKFDKDNPHLKYVSDSEHTDGATYESKFVDEVWEGTQIGNDIFYQMRPVPGQHLIGDYVERKTLDFVGIIDPNPALLRLIQPFEALRMEVFFALEKLTAQAKGKILVVDEANESDSTDNAYNMAVHSTYRYNSAKEGDQQLLNPNGAKNLNKPDVVDLGISSAINVLYSFLNLLDTNVGQITGINGARRGELKSDTGLGQLEQSNTMSAMATHPYFKVFYTVVGMALQKMCEKMQISWGGKDITKYFLGENGMELLKMMSESEWHLARYGVFIENGETDVNLQANVIRLAEAWMPITTEPQFALALIKMQSATSAKEAEQIFEKAVEALDKIKKENAKAAQQQQQVQLQIAQAEEEAENARVKMRSLDGPLAVKKQEGENDLRKESMKQDFKMDEQTVEKQDNLDMLVAEDALNEPATMENNFTE